MNIFITILLILAGIIALLLLLALIIRKTYHVQRSVVINAPLQKVFDYIRLLRNQDNFNKWVMADPNMKKEFRGTDGSVGFVYAWNGNKNAGEGELEIISLEEGKSIGHEIRFVRPMPSVAFANMTTESLSADQTKVTWSNTGKMKYPMNLMVAMIEKMLGKDMDISLSNLKSILE